VRTCDAVSSRLEQLRTQSARPPRRAPPPPSPPRLPSGPRPPRPRNQARTAPAVAAAHAADLLRTSLTVQQQAQNVKELEQLQANSRTQLLLQESVEGLSVVAITYYSTGVFGYLAKGASALGWLPVPLEVALAMSVPVLGSVAYMGLHRLKAGVMKAHR
jgi:uncharacterized membrane-anchored protein